MALAGGLRILQTVSSCRLTLHEIMVSCRHARLPPIIYKQARVPASQQARACSGHTRLRSAICKQSRVPAAQEARACSAASEPYRIKKRQRCPINYTDLNTVKDAQ